MNNYNITLDLLKVHGAFLANIKGKSATKRCLCIPIEDGIYLGEKGCYLTISAWEQREAKYDKTHLLKQSFPKEQREAMTEDERRSQPIIGNMKPIETTHAGMNVTQTMEAALDDDDLPF